MLHGRRHGLRGYPMVTYHASGHRDCLEAVEATAAVRGEAVRCRPSLKSVATPKSLSFDEARRRRQRRSLLRWCLHCAGAEKLLGSSGSEGRLDRGCQWPWVCQSGGLRQLHNAGAVRLRGNERHLLCAPQSVSSRASRRTPAVGATLGILGPGRGPANGGLAVCVSSGRDVGGRVEDAGDVETSSREVFTARRWAQVASPAHRSARWPAFALEPVPRPPCRPAEQGGV